MVHGRVHVQPLRHVGLSKQQPATDSNNAWDLASRDQPVNRDASGAKEIRDVISG
jgi:hypothetical protein